MDSKPAQNIQDTFLNTVRKDKSPHHDLPGERRETDGQDPFVRQVFGASGEQQPGAVDLQARDFDGGQWSCRNSPGRTT